jgi:hypothetical protein
MFWAVGDPRAGLDAVEKRQILHRRELIPNRPAVARRYTDSAINHIYPKIYLYFKEQAEPPLS